MTDKKVNVAIVGLGFGAEFIPIYQRHPNANMYAISQRTESCLLYTSPSPRDGLLSRMPSSA